MIVLHILLGILKGIGMLLLLLLLLILAGLLAVLFCPVRYRVSAKKDADSYEGEAGISWLFHLLSVSIGYESRAGEMHYSVRIFGIPLESVRKLFAGRRKKQKTEETTSETVPQTEEEPLPSVESEMPETEQEVPEDLPQEQVEERKKTIFSAIREGIEKVAAWIKKILAIPRKIKDALRNFGLTVQKICGKIEQAREFLESEHFINAKTLVFGEAAKTFRHIAPKKGRGILKFGMEDPFVTGEILAAAGIFYPLYGEHLTIEPYFDRKILEGNLYVSGRIRGSFFVGLAWRIFRNSDIRYIIKKFK